MERDLCRTKTEMNGKKMKVTVYGNDRSEMNIYLKCVKLFKSLYSIVSTYGRPHETLNQG